MLAYIGRRAILAIFTVWAISVLSFAIIQLPPGDYVTSYIAQMASMGSVVSDEEAQNLRIQYGLGQPIYIQYLKWIDRKSTRLNSSHSQISYAVFCLNKK